MTDIKNNLTMTYLLKEYVYQRRWMWCLFTIMIILPFGIIATVPITHYDLKYRFEQSNSGFKSGFVALCFAIVEAVIAFIVFLSFNNVTVTVIISILAAFTGIWGIYSIMLCKKINTRNALFDYFDNIIEVHHITSVAKIAKIIGKSEDATLKSLSDMISLQRLEKAAISGNLKEVVVFRKWYKQSFVCKNCGGEYSINIGDEVICPYCGSPSEENYLGDFSDNIKEEKSSSLLISYIRKNTLPSALASIVLQISSLFLCVSLTRNEAYYLFFLSTLLLITGMVLGVLAAVYGDEAEFEKCFNFFRKHRFTNSVVLFVSGLLSFNYLLIGFVLYILYFISDNISSVAGVLETTFNLINGGLIIIVGALCFVLVLRASAKEKGYWS